MAKSRIRSYIKKAGRRLSVFALLILSAFLSHRLFAYIHQEILGALLFILIFSGGVLYYYFNLLQKNGSGRKEYLASVFFTLIMIITMFAIIYSEPIRGSSGKENYFLEFDKPTNLTFADAFYFSTTTVTTVGYGDIVPVGIFRLIVTIEVFMGLIYTGSMIYFLTKAFEEEEVKEIEKFERASTIKKNLRKGMPHKKE